MFVYRAVGNGVRVLVLYLLVLLVMKLYTIINFVISLCLSTYTQYTCSLPMLKCARAHDIEDISGTDCIYLYVHFVCSYIYICDGNKVLFINFKKESKTVNTHLKYFDGHTVLYSKAPII